MISVIYSLHKKKNFDASRLSLSRAEWMVENLKESSMKTPAYEYEDEAQQFLAEIACLPLSLRPKGQLYHVERKIAEALGGLTAGKPLDFTYEEDVWKGYKQIGIVIADERMIFSLKCCARFLAQEIE